MSASAAAATTASADTSTSLRPGSSSSSSSSRRQLRDKAKATATSPTIHTSSEWKRKYEDAVVRSRSTPRSGGGGKSSSTANNVTSPASSSSSRRHHRNLNNTLLSSSKRSVSALPQRQRRQEFATNEETTAVSSSDSMEQILAPDYDYDDDNKNWRGPNTPRDNDVVVVARSRSFTDGADAADLDDGMMMQLPNTYSADSIIRRVEQEIANARKAVASPQQQRRLSSTDHEDASQTAIDDMLRDEFIHETTAMEDSKNRNTRKQQQQQQPFDEQVEEKKEETSSSHHNRHRRGSGNGGTPTRRQPPPSSPSPSSNSSSRGRNNRNKNEEDGGGAGAPSPASEEEPSTPPPPPESSPARNQHGMMRMRMDRASPPMSPDRQPPLQQPQQKMDPPATSSSRSSGTTTAVTPTRRLQSPPQHQQSPRTQQQQQQRLLSPNRLWTTTVAAVVAEEEGATATSSNNNKNNESITSETTAATETAQQQQQPLLPPHPRSPASPGIKSPTGSGRASPAASSLSPTTASKRELLDSLKEQRETLGHHTRRNNHHHHSPLFSSSADGSSATSPSATAPTTVSSNSPRRLTAEFARKQHLLHNHTGSTGNSSAPNTPPAAPKQPESHAAEQPVGSPRTTTTDTANSNSKTPRRRVLNGGGDTTPRTRKALEGLVASGSSRHTSRLLSSRNKKQDAYNDVHDTQRAREMDTSITMEDDPSMASNRSSRRAIPQTESSMTSNTATTAITGNLNAGRGGGGGRDKTDTASTASGSTGKPPSHFTFTRARELIQKSPRNSRVSGRSSNTHTTMSKPSSSNAEIRSVASSTTDLNNRRIRFRNPFPVLKPPHARRNAQEIIQDYKIELPNLNLHFVKPQKELKQLIVAAMGTSLQRRSNACGALKVLTQLPKNQLALVRTDGFLSALICAASPKPEKNNALAQDARNRAVTCLRHVCTPKDNRILVFTYAGVTECLVKVMATDRGESRAFAAASIAMLAKTPACREGLAFVEGLVDVLAKVLLGQQEEDDDDEDEADEESKENQQHLVENMESVSEMSRHQEDDDDDEDNSVVSSEDVSLSASLSSENKKLLLEEVPKLQRVDSIRSQAEERKEEFLQTARSNVCAALLHMSKQCTISNMLCANDELLYSVLSVAQEVNNPIHSKCLEIICNFSRFPSNNEILTRYDGVIATLVTACNSPRPENRLHALLTLQNMSADPSSKSILATSPVLNLMTTCAMRKEAVEKQVAVATIYNITTEPSAVTSITNTKNVVATLVHLAHSPDSSSEVRLLACEALATISLWLQTLAGTGKVPEGLPLVPLPSQKTTGWERF